MRRVEWPTVGLLLACYTLWGVMTALYSEIGPVFLILLTAPLVTLHSSLQHEALHGHPTRSTAVNEALVFLPLGLLFPYRRFKMLHLRHQTRIQDCRVIVHTPEFKAEELRFNEYEDAKNWLRHL